MVAELEAVLKLKDELSGPLANIDKNVGGFSKTLGVGLKAAAVGGGVAVAGLGAFLATSVKEAMESQKVIAQLESVLKSTGGTAGLTSQEIQDMASGFQKVTTFGDEAILSAQNLLLTFTNIKGPAFQGATQAVLDMATAMGTDLDTAAIQVGKALNDPIQGVGALRRVGVQLSDDQEKQIKTFMELGDVASAQGIILKELSTQFGGSAAAAADTFGGRMQQLKNTFGEVQEKVGMALLPILQDLAEELNAFLTEHEADIDRFIEQFMTFAESEAWPFLKDTFKQLKQFIQGIIDTGIIQWLAEHKEAALALAVALGLVVVVFAPWILAIPAAIAVGALLLAHWDEIKAKADELINKVREFPIIGEIVEAVFGFVRARVEFYMTSVKAIIDIVMGVLTGDWDRAWQGLKALALAPLQLLQADVGVVLEAIKGIAGDLAGQIGQAITAPLEIAKGGVQDALNWIIDRINEFTSGLNDVLGPIGGILGKVGVSVPEIPQLGHVGGGEGSRGRRYGGVMDYDTGGEVPGPLGMAQLAVVHGGERVLTPAQQQSWGIDYDRLASALARQLRNVRIEMSGRTVAQIVRDESRDSERRGGW